MTPNLLGNCTAVRATLYVAFELGWRSWKLAFTVGLGQKPRVRSVTARDLEAVRHEIAQAKKRFALPADAAVRSCYEAGRDGFWLHRWLHTQRIENLVVDSSSIEVNRRRRRAKSDRLDATKLVLMLVRWANGESKVWSVVTVPSEAAEQGRQLHRELGSLRRERTQHVNRIKGLLATQGLAVRVEGNFLDLLPQWRRWDDTPVPAELQTRLVREYQRLQLVERQIAELERERVKQIRADDSTAGQQVRELLRLRGLGPNSAWLFVRELFGWRAPQNRRQVGALCGLVPTPYASGDSEREQGISKAGIERVRSLAVEIAWLWLEYQPNSALSRWYAERFGSGNARMRRVGIVAVARKLMVALWKYLKHGEVPQGAVFKDELSKEVGAERKQRSKPGAAGRRRE